MSDKKELSIEDRAIEFAYSITDDKEIAICIAAGYAKGAGYEKSNALVEQSIQFDLAQKKLAAQSKLLEEMAETLRDVSFDENLADEITRVLEAHETLKGKG